MERVSDRKWKTECVFYEKEKNSERAQKRTKSGQSNMKSIWFFTFYDVVFLLLFHLIWFKSPKKIHLNLLNSKIKLYFQLKIPHSVRLYEWKTAIEKTKRTSICAFRGWRKNANVWNARAHKKTYTELFGKWINRISELHFRLSITCFRAHCSVYEDGEKSTFFTCPKLLLLSLCCCCLPILLCMAFTKSFLAIARKNI